MRPVLLLLGSLFFVACCASPPSEDGERQAVRPPDVAQPSADQAFQEFQSRLADGQYYACCVIWPAAEADLGRTTSEGAAGLEYQRLLAKTAAMGQKEWNLILRSERIEKALKQDLVDQIHESALHSD